MAQRNHNEIAARHADMAASRDPRLANAPAHSGRALAAWYETERDWDALERAWEAAEAERQSAYHAWWLATHDSKGCACYDCQADRAAADYELRNEWGW